MKVCLVALMAMLVMAASVSTAATLQDTLPVTRPWRRAHGHHTIDMSQTLDMAIGLKRKNMAELERIFWDVSDPKSANYGNHLNHEEMRALISPAKSAIEAVKAWLSFHGINDVEVARHEDSMKFKATRAQVASLLKVKFEMFENKETKQQSARALGAIDIPEELLSVIELIAGHRGFPMPPAKRPVPKKVGGPWNMNVTPQVLYKQYNETDIPPTPANVTNIQSFFQAQGQFVRSEDLKEFCNDFFGPDWKGNCKIDKYIGTDSNQEPGVESSLDSQYITATGHGLETWVYSYQGVDFCKDLLAWGQDVFSEANGTFPYVISMSYGAQNLPTYCTGDGLNRIAADTMKMGTMGITVVIASGDNGSGEFSRSGWNWGYLGVSFPAEIPYVTAVGSTTFEEGNSGTERAASFSGGGFSFSFEAPSYQKAAIDAFFANTSNHLPSNPKSYNKTGRANPDVSVLGEAFFVINDATPMSVAGTSCSTPSFAGMVARLNNVRLLKGKTLGFINPLLYSNPQGFTDITAGDNDMNHDGNGWYATKGWDPVTGLGTPKFDELVKIVKALNEKQ